MSRLNVRRGPLRLIPLAGLVAITLSAVCQTAASAAPTSLLPELENTACESANGLSAITASFGSPPEEPLAEEIKYGDLSQSQYWGPTSAGATCGTSSPTAITSGLLGGDQDDPAILAGAHATLGWEQGEFNPTDLFVYYQPCGGELFNAFDLSENVGTHTESWRGFFDTQIFAPFNIIGEDGGLQSGPGMGFGQVTGMTEQDDSGETPVGNVSPGQPEGSVAYIGIQMLPDPDTDGVFPSANEQVDPVPCLNQDSGGIGMAAAVFHFSVTTSAV